MFFDVLGTAVGAYTGYAAWRGSVVAKSGPFARTILRSERPGYFWAVITVYAGLALALIFIF